MARRHLPETPDFSSIEEKAIRHAGRQNEILGLIGNLVFAWSNNESMFIYILMILLDTDEATAAVVFTTLNTTRARLDLIQRLAGLKISDLATARALNSLIRRFTSCTRLRNEFNHCMYTVNDEGEITHMHAMRIEEGRGRFQFGSVREMDQKRVDEILATIRQLRDLNREIWSLLPRLDAAMGRTPGAAAGE